MFQLRSGPIGLSICAALWASCAGTTKTQTPSSDLSDFECNDRKVDYMVVGGFVADEAGVSMHCQSGTPTIVKWHLEEGKRIEQSAPLTGEQFDAAWEKVDSTGWRHMKTECNNPDATPSDPAYVMDVGDYAKSMSFSCNGKTLPFPYDRIVNELDLRAVGFGDQDQRR